MIPEFWLVLDEKFSDDLADRVYEAGFDDSVLTTAAEGSATIEVSTRAGEFTELIRQAIEQAEQAGLSVRHVILPRDVFSVSG